MGVGVVGWSAGVERAITVTTVSCFRVGKANSSPISGIKNSTLKPMGFPRGSDSKESALNGGNLGSIPELGRLPGGGIGNPLQYSCLGNPMDRGAWWATVHGVAKELGTTDQLKQQQQLKPVCLDNQNPALLGPVSWSYVPALFPSQEPLLCWRADNLLLKVVASQVLLGAAGAWAVSGHP